MRRGATASAGFAYHRAMGYSVVLNDDLLAFAERIVGETELHLDTGGPPGHGIQLRLRQVRELRAAEPWPALHVAWSTKHLEAERMLTVPERRFGSGGPTDAQLAHERMVVEVITRLRANPNAKGAVVDPGWVAFPVVPWEDVEGLPLDDAVGEGAFRTAADVDPVVARRAGPSPLESMLVWIASSPDRRLVDTPREVVLTRAQLYARFAEGVTRRLPRTSLRERLGPADDDAVYVFGRRTRLVLTHREGCPVREALDAQLEGET